MPIPPSEAAARQAGGRAVARAFRARLCGVFYAAIITACVFARVATAQTSTPDLKLQLEIAGGGNTATQTVNVNDEITLNIYGIVSVPTGVDATTAKNRIDYVFGSVTGEQQAGLLQGGFTASSLTTQFDKTGSSAGTIVNSTTSGYDRVGSTRSTQTATSSSDTTNFFQARNDASGTPISSTVAGSTKFLLGTVTYTVTAVDATSGDVKLNFELPTFTPLNERKALFYQNGLAKNDLNSSILSGTDVVLTAGASDAYWKGGSGLWSQDSTAGATNFRDSATLLTTQGVLPGVKTTVHFTSGGDTTLGKDFSIKALQFHSGASDSSISGPNTLTLGGSNGITVDLGSGAHTISSDVRLGASQTWTNDASNALTVSGVVSEPTGTGATPKSLTTAGTGTINLNGNNTFTGALTVNGGTTNLNGSNAAAGATTINGGTLNAAATGALGQTGAITVNNGGTLLLGNSAATDRVKNDAVITLTGGTLKRGSGVSEGSAGTYGSAGSGAAGLGLLTLTADSTLDLQPIVKIDNLRSGLIPCESKFEQLL